jgi:hypothetical protein
LADASDSDLGSRIGIVEPDVIWSGKR